MADKVNHPKHYNKGKIEVIDFIEDQQLNFHRGTAVKYIVRAGDKEPDVGQTLEEKEIEDLKKALWYIKREIHLLEVAYARGVDSTSKESASDER